MPEIKDQAAFLLQLNKAIKAGKLTREQIMAVLDTRTTRAPLTVCGADDFLSRKFKEKEVLFETQNLKSAVFHTASINQTHAWRGVGKTNFMLGLSGAAAHGAPFLFWQATRRFRTLYVEGELPGVELQQRVRQLVGPCPDYFFVITPEAQESCRLPSIAGPEGRELVEQALVETRAEVLVLDSISSLANITTNEEKEWLSLLDWFMYLRVRYAVALFYCQHDGKGGLQRGHSKSEDLLDKSVHLYWESDHHGVEGLRCLLKFDKARQPVREAAHLKIELAAEEGMLQSTWLCELAQPAPKTGSGRPAEVFPDTVLDRVGELLQSHPQLSNPKLAKALGFGTNHHKAQNARQQWQDRETKRAAENTAPDNTKF